MTEGNLLERLMTFPDRISAHDRAEQMVYDYMTAGSKSVKQEFYPNEYSEIDFTRLQTVNLVRLIYKKVNNKSGDELGIDTAWIAISQEKNNIYVYLLTDKKGNKISGEDLTEMPFKLRLTGTSPKEMVSALAQKFVNQGHDSGIDLRTEKAIVMVGGFPPGKSKGAPVFGKPTLTLSPEGKTNENE